MSGHIVVNVEEQIAWRLFQAGEIPAARQAILRSASLDNDTKFADLERQREGPGLSEKERKAEQREAAEVSLRRERNARLAATDWTQLPDVPESTRVAFAAYRQKLRDLPAKTKNPTNVTWPEVPDA